MVDRDYMRGDYGGGPGGGMQLQMPRLTPMVKLLIMANVAVYLVTFLASFFGAGYLIQDYLGLNTALPWLFPLQVFTHQFLHSLSDLGHLFFNMLALYFFGTAVEGWLGSRRFLRLYLLAGVAGGLGFLCWALLRGGGIAVGASGAVSGVVIYFCLVQPRAIIFLLFFPIRAWVFGAGWFCIETFALLVELRDGAGSNLAHSAHLGGALLGFLFWRYEGWMRRLLQAIAAKQAADRARKEARDRQRMDELLAKVNRQGLHALTEEERRFLQEMSRRMKGG